MLKALRIVDAELYDCWLWSWMDAAMLLQMYCGHFNKSGIIETPAARVVGLREMEPEVPE